MPVRVLTYHRVFEKFEVQSYAYVGFGRKQCECNKYLVALGSPVRKQISIFAFDLGYGVVLTLHSFEFLSCIYDVFVFI